MPQRNRSRSINSIQRRHPFPVMRSRELGRSSIVSFFLVVGAATTHHELTNPAKGCEKHQDGGCPRHGQESITSISG